MGKGTWVVGDVIHGFASGYFGRDSYDCRYVEAVGKDWLVTRNTQGRVELISKSDADRILDPNDLSFCEPYEGDRCPFRRDE